MHEVHHCAALHALRNRINLQRDSLAAKIGAHASRCRSAQHAIAAAAAVGLAAQCKRCTDAKQIPMLSSAPIETEAGERFRVDVYPRGNTGKRAAAVYLRYLSRGTGDDVDATFSLALRVNGTTVPTLSGCGGAEKGGAPMRRGAMTFCGAAEAVESCGRAADWGAHAWPGCRTGDEPSAVVEIATWSRRSGETSAASAARSARRRGGGAADSRTLQGRRGARSGS